MKGTLMGTTIQAIPCPVIEDKRGLKGEDRLCHVPETRLRYLSLFPDTPCHTDGACQVCNACPQAVHAEIHSFETEKAVVRRSSGIKWAEERRV